MLISGSQYAEDESRGITVTRGDGSDVGSFLIQEDADGFERLVFAEILIPDVPNVYGDFHTKRSVRDFAYGFMVNGFGIDLDHDNVDRTGGIHVVESFIARPGDPTFIEGSWVVGSWVPDDEVWARVLDGTINGYSYEALVSSTFATIVLPDQRAFTTVTEPDKFDGHTHKVFVVVDADGRVLIGGTSYDQGHRHSVYRHTFTETTFGHCHIFNFVQGKGGL